MWISYHLISKVMLTSKNIKRREQRTREILWLTGWTSSLIWIRMLSLERILLRKSTRRSRRDCQLGLIREEPTVIFIMDSYTQTIERSISSLLGLTEDLSTVLLWLLLSTQSQMPRNTRIALHSEMQILAEEKSNQASSKILKSIISVSQLVT